VAPGLHIVGVVLKTSMAVAARNRALTTYWALTLISAALALYLALYRAPVNELTGSAQKMFYLHFPVAMNTFLACFFVFLASLGYLWQRRPLWDDLALASARVSVLFSAVVLATGMIWAHSAWNLWWTWSPRLTFSLVLLALYLFYLVLRPIIRPPSRRARVCAVYGVIAFLDVPLVYLSVKLLPDIHPPGVSGGPAAHWIVAASFVPVTMLCAGLIAAGYLHAARKRLDAADAADDSTLRPISGAGM